MASGPITSWEIDGKQCQTLFFGAPKSLKMVTAAMKLKDTSWKKSNDKPRKRIKKKERDYFTDKGLYSQNYSVDYKDLHQ